MVDRNGEYMNCPEGSIISGLPASSGNGEPDIGVNAPLVPSTVNPYMVPGGPCTYRSFPLGAIAMLEINGFGALPSVKGEPGTVVVRAPVVASMAHPSTTLLNPPTPA